MLSKKKLAKIDMLKRKREMLRTNVECIELAITRINKKLFDLITRKK